MEKTNKKIISIVIATLLLVAFCIGVYALSGSSHIFKKVTPTYMKLGNQVKGNISDAKDYDAYMFKVSNNGTVSLKFTHDGVIDSSKTGWIINLYKAEKNGVKTFREIAQYQCLWSEANSKWSPLGLTAGEYVVTIRPVVYLHESNYTFSASYKREAVYEAEPNDTKEEANLINVGYGKYGVSSQRENINDTDWYKFVLDKDSVVSVSLTHPDLAYPQVGWNITLINENGDKISQFTARLQGNISKTGALGLRAGTYYVSVDSQSELADEYTISVGADLAENTEFELNDTYATATELPQNQQITGCLADRVISIDKDYYKINVPKDGVLNISFNHETVNKDNDGWNIRVIKPIPNSDDYEIVKKVSKWNQHQTNIENLGVEKGEYYILIDGDSLVFNQETYMLKWSLTESQNYEKEPNNTRISANIINPGTSYSGVIHLTEPPYDEDYYKFELKEPSTALLEFSHKRAEGSDVCWYASIVDVDDFEMCSIKSRLNGGRVTTPTIELPAGVYYVKIETGKHSSELPYTFEVTVSGTGV